MQCMKSLFTVLLLAVSVDFIFGSENVGVQNDFKKGLNNHNTAKVEVVKNDGLLSAGRSDNQQKAGALKLALLPNAGSVRETLQPNPARETNQLNFNVVTEVNRANPNQINPNQAFQGEDNQHKPGAIVEDNRPVVVTEKNFVQVNNFLYTYACFFSI